MTNVFVTRVVGADDTAAALLRTADEVPVTTGHEIRKVMERSKRVLVQQPPQRPGQTYVRTQTLVSGWKVTNVQSPYVGHGLQNYTPYTQWVTGNEFGQMQAWMHVNRWPVFREVVEEFVEEVPDNIKKQIMVVAGAAGLRTG